LAGFQTFNRSIRTSTILSKRKAISRKKYQYPQTVVKCRYLYRLILQTYSGSEVCAAQLISHVRHSLADATTLLEVEKLDKPIFIRADEFILEQKAEISSHHHSEPNVIPARKNTIAMDLYTKHTESFQMITTRLEATTN